MDLEASEDSSPRTPVTQCQGVSIYYERASWIFFEEVRVGGRHHVVFKDTREAGTDACHLSNGERPDVSDERLRRGRTGIREDLHREDPAVVVDPDTDWISSKWLRPWVAFGLAVLVGDELPDANERVPRSG
jgi:hypothetical protein